MWFSLFSYLFEFKEFFIFGFVLCKIFFPVCHLYLFSWHFLSQNRKFLVLKKFSLSIISFMNHASDVLSKKSFLRSRLSRCSCMLPPRSFIVLYFTFRSVIHFEFIFVKGVRSRFSFVCLAVCLFVFAGDVKLFSYHLWKRLVFHQFCPLLLYLKISWLHLWGLFLDSLFCSIYLFAYTFVNTTLPWLS